MGMYIVMVMYIVIYIYIHAGRNCRFLQCHMTEPEAVEAMAMALRTQQPCEIRITNQRKDGSIFVNLLVRSQK